VRFFLSFCSTDNQFYVSCVKNYPNGTQINQLYLNALQAFFADLHAAGISNVIVTPSFDDPNDPKYPVAAQYYSCTPNVPVALTFFPLLPYGKFPGNAQGDLYPYPQGINQGYGCSPSNPYFLGGEYMTVPLVFISYNAQQAGVTVTEVDLTQEVNLHDFTVQARLLLDNTTSCDGTQQGNGNQCDIWDSAVDAVRPFNSPTASIVLSVQSNHPVDARTPPCASYYGDPGQHVLLSEMLAALNVWWIGTPAGEQSGSGLACGGSYSSDMVVLYRLFEYAVTTVDVHDYACFLGDIGCSNASPTDIFNQAVLDFTAYRDTLSLWGPNPTNNVPVAQSVDVFNPGGVYWDKYNQFIAQGLLPSLALPTTQVWSAGAVVGETWAESPCIIAGFSNGTDPAPVTYNGYLNSTLYQIASQPFVIMEPWYTTSSCFAVQYPWVLNPPYVPRSN